MSDCTELVIESFCRVCKKQVTSFVDIFSTEGVIMKLQQIITFVEEEPVTPSDKKSKTVCRPCISNISSYYRSFHIADECDSTTMEQKNYGNNSKQEDSQPEKESANED